MKPIKLIFQFGDGGTHDAGVSEASTAEQICLDYRWSLIPDFSGLDASPLYSIEVSNNGIDFSPYDTATEDAAIDQGFDDTHLAFTYIRINYKANGNTAGTVSFTLTLKQ